LQSPQDVLNETETHDAELARLKRDRARIQEGLQAVTAKETRRTAVLARATLMSQFVVAALGLAFPYCSAHTAHAIHLDYYSAVSAIAPVLLVAGFVELAILGLSTAVWAVLSFAVPAVGAGGAALLVLASHDSTPFTLFLTVWGLAATLISRVVYVIFHTKSPSSRA
jgi:hypothetical protein